MSVSRFVMPHLFMGPRRPDCDCPYCFEIPEERAPTAEEIAERERRERLWAMRDRMDALAEQGKYIAEREEDGLENMLVAGAIDVVLNRTVNAAKNRAH